MQGSDILDDRAGATPGAPHAGAGEGLFMLSFKRGVRGHRRGARIGKPLNDRERKRRD